MIKNNFIRLAIVAAMGIAPSWGAEGEITEFDDTGLTDLKITNVYLRDADKIGVKLQVTNQAHRQELRRLPAFFEFSGWKQNDEQLFSKKIGKAVLDCKNAGEVTSEEVTLSTQYSYQLLTKGSLINLINNVKKPDSELFLGDNVSVCEESSYKRPDGSVYNQTTPLYQARVKATYNGREVTEIDLQEALKVNFKDSKVCVDVPFDVYLEEIVKEGETKHTESNRVIYRLVAEKSSTDKGLVNHCWKHENEWQQKGIRGYNQLRHWHETYSSIEETIGFYKLSSDGQKTLLPNFSKSELLLHLQSRDEGRKNKPECPAPYYQGFPPNSRVVS